MILTNVRLIPELSGGVQTENGSVEIQNGKIIGVFKTPSPNSEAMDCKGMTLLPGLIDLHTHITVLGQIGFDKLHSPMGLLVAAAKHATQYLDMGFTTIRDCGSSQRVANFVKQMAANGTIDAPDIISCGRAIMPTEGEAGHPMTYHVHFADTVEEMRKATREEMAEGADFVKIFASGAAANPSGVPQQSIMTFEEIKAVVETAARKGKYVAAHCHSDEAIRLCLEAGVKTIEHATLISDETLEKMLSQRETYMIPTLAVMHISDGPNKEYWQKRLGPMFENCTRQMAKAYEAGALLGFGTDCCAGDYCYNHGIEFKFRKDNCGMKDLDILLQATRNNAIIAGIDHQVGEIKEGLLANLILVDGKPDQDISAMYKAPVCVWKTGKKVRKTN